MNSSVARLKVYFREMFPPEKLLAPLLMALCFFISLAKLENLSLSSILANPNSHFVWLSSFALVLFVLLLRVMDEYKDYEDDLVNYPERPLPSGRVKFSDLNALFSSIVLFLGFLHLLPFNLTFAAAGIVVFGYSWLMFKWFFSEQKIRSSLPLAFWSHHPIIPIYFLYLSVSWLLSGLSLNPAHMLLIIPFTLMSTNWEIARKIRSPELENNYTTYSQILGTRQAIFLALLIQWIILASITFYFYRVQAPLSFMAFYVLSFVGTQVSEISFLFHLKQKDRLQWRRAAESQIFLTYILIFAEFIFFS